MAGIRHCAPVKHSRGADPGTPQDPAADRAPAPTQANPARRREDDGAWATQASPSAHCGSWKRWRASGHLRCPNDSTADPAHAELAPELADRRSDGTAIP